MTYTTTQLPPVEIRLPGQRTQRLEWAVMEAGRVRAVFADERQAEAYARRLNAWTRQHA